MKLLLNNRLKRNCFTAVFLIFFLFAFSQEKLPVEDLFTKIDSLYREDQFYLGVTFNSIRNAPQGFSNTDISSGFSAGFLRDMPINKNRNVAFAAGLGLAFNNYNQNIGFANVNGVPTYSFLNSATSYYSKNRFSHLLLEIPIEFRWRDSTFENTQFWRFHGGIKLSYLTFSLSVFESPDRNSTVTNNPDFSKWLYGTYFSAGYGGINLYVYYSLNSMFKSAYINAEKINIQALNIGLVYYIL